MNEQLAIKMNEQVNNEFSSGYAYLAMAVYLEGLDLPGFAHFFEVQQQEENFHAMKFYRYILENGADIQLQTIEAPSHDFTSIVDVFEKAYEHELWITSTIYQLMDIAMAEKDYRAISFLNWFVDEQAEEETMMDELVKKVTRIGNDAQGLYALDAELAQRTFVPPVDGE